MLVEKAEGTARIIKARSESEEMKARAEGEIAKNRAAATALSPLAVQKSAYDALGKLGSTGTTVYLGDFSHVPAFLFPKGAAYTLAPIPPPSGTP